VSAVRATVFVLLRSDLEFTDTGRRDLVGPLLLWAPLQGYLTVGRGDEQIVIHLSSCAKVERRDDLGETTADLLDWARQAVAREQASHHRAAAESAAAARTRLAAERHAQADRLVAEKDAWREAHRAREVAAAAPPPESEVERDLRTAIGTETAVVALTDAERAALRSACVARLAHTPRPECLRWHVPSDGAGYFVCGEAPPGVQQYFVRFATCRDEHIWHSWTGGAFGAFFSANDWPVSSLRRPRRAVALTGAESDFSEGHRLHVPTWT